MKTLIIHETDREQYYDMLPGELMFLLYDPSVILFGKIDETEQGAVPAALMILSAASEREPVLEWIYVKEEYRGRGIGEDLMMQAFTFAKQLGNNVLRARMRLPKTTPKTGKKDKDGYVAELYGQREWLDSFGFYWDESQANEWMFFVSDMIDAKPDIFKKKYSGVKPLAVFSKAMQGKIMKKTREMFGDDVTDALDLEVSSVLADGDELLSMLLVMRTDETYTPICFQSAGHDLEGLLPVAAYAANAAIEKSDDIAMLHMVWKNENMMRSVKDVLGDVPPVETMMMVADADMPERLKRCFEEDREDIRRMDELVEKIPTKFHVVDVEYLSGVVLEDMP